MRIAIDASSAAKSTRTGVGRYIAQLVDALVRLGTDARFDLLYRFSRWKQRAHFLDVDGPNVTTKCLMEPFHPFYPRRLSVFHGPDARLPSFGGVPFVATIHDTFNADSEAWADAGFREKKRARYRDLATRADALIACSGYTKDRFVANTDVDADKVHVIHHGVDPMFRDVAPDRVTAVRDRLGLDRPYAFYVGQLSTRKNLSRVLEAFAGTDGDLLLALAGPSSHGTDAIRETHERLGLGDRVRWLGAVADADLPALYAGACFHVLLSLDEGFGMPVLEAFAAGTPVLASTSGAIPEVADGAAWLVDPTDVGAMRDAMRSLAGSSSERDRLRSRGLARASGFTWAANAAATMALYEEVSR